MRRIPPFLTACVLADVPPAGAADELDELELPQPAATVARAAAAHTARAARERIMAPPGGRPGLTGCGSSSGSSPAVTPRRSASVQSSRLIVKGVFAQ